MATSEHQSARTAAGPWLLRSFEHGGHHRAQRRRIPTEGLEFGQGGVVFDTPFADSRMAPRHAEIRRASGRFVIRPLDARPPVRVNGHAIDGPTPLTPGDVLRLGDTLMLFLQGGDDTEQQDAEGPEPCAGQGMAPIRRSVQMVAPHRHSVVITGETGVGKEVVAQLIHQRSGRTGPMLAVNCAMFSEALLASELFGHVRGAFTGAVGDQLGLFRAANHGTLLLDEMSDMPLPLQASLLRVLDTGTVRPVGSTRDIPIDTRIVATSNRELMALVQEDRFRADLYSRLAQWTIRVPPLRDRREDIESLTDVLLRRCGAEKRRLTPDLAEALLVHAWPHNVRGLLNILSIAEIASPGNEPLGLQEEVQLALWASRSLDVPDLPESGAEFDRDAIDEALTHCHGGVAATARQLGVSRPRLYRMFARFGVDPASYRRAWRGG